MNKITVKRGETCNESLATHRKYAGTGSAMLAFMFLPIISVAGARKSIHVHLIEPFFQGSRIGLQVGLHQIA